MDPDAVALWLGEHQLMAAGTYLLDDTVVIRLVVGQGSGAATAWGCDLSDQYVRINADYTT